MKVKILTTKKIKIEEERTVNVSDILSDVFSHSTFDDIVWTAVQTNISSDYNTTGNIDLISEQIIEKLNELVQNGTFDNL